MCFQIVGTKLYLLPENTSVSTMNLESRRLSPITRLDEIVGHLNLQAVNNIPPKYNQSFLDGKLRIQPCPLAMRDFASAEKMFNLNICIWTSKMDKNKHRVYERLRSGTGKNGDIEVNLHLEPLGGLVYVQDPENYFSGLFYCPNQRHGCQFTFRSLDKMEQHCLNCKTLEEVRILFGAYTSFMATMSLIILQISKYSRVLQTL